MPPDSYQKHNDTHITYTKTFIIRHTPRTYLHCILSLHTWTIAQDDVHGN